MSTALLDRPPAPIDDDLTRRRLFTGAGALAVGWALAGCSTDGTSLGEETPATRTFVDGLGRSIEVPDRPQRIVALNDGNGGAQILSLGLPLVGLTTRDGVLDPSNVGMADSEVLVGVTPVGDYAEPDVEAIATLRPDLIVAYLLEREDGMAVAFLDDAQIARLERIAPVVAPSTFEPVAEVMTSFGLLLGVESEAEQQRVAFDQRAADIRDRMAVDLSRLSVANFYLFGADDFRVNRGTLSTVTQALELVLGADIWSASIYDDFTEAENQRSFSLERISDLSADLVIHRPFDAELTSARQLLDALPAAAAGQVYAEPDPTEVNLSRTYGGLDNALDFLEPILTDTGLRADLLRSTP